MTQYDLALAVAGEPNVRPRMFSLHVLLLIHVPREYVTNGDDNADIHAGHLHHGRDHYPWPGHSAHEPMLSSLFDGNASELKPWLRPLFAVEL